SNIVIRFFGWVDQREADWAKARSNAIAAVKAALEQGGFAIPEPIYRLRFDAQGPQLPIAAPEGKPIDEARTASDTPPPKPTVPRAEEQNVAPDNELAEMVERERESG